MSSTRLFARVYGIVFLLIGIMGFIPALLTHPHATPGDHGEHGLSVTAFEGYLLGLFHVNILHSLVHVLFGVMGLAASRTWDGSRSYARLVAISYFALAVFGLIPGLKMLFGLVPLHGNDVWLHVLLALPAAYFGFAAARRPVGDVAAVRVNNP